MVRKNTFSETFFFAERRFIKFSYIVPNIRFRDSDAARPHGETLFTTLFFQRTLRQERLENFAFLSKGGKSTTWKMEVCITFMIFSKLDVYFYMSAFVVFILKNEVMFFFKCIFFFGLF